MRPERSPLLQTARAHRLRGLLVRRMAILGRKRGNPLERLVERIGRPRRNDGLRRQSAPTIIDPRAYPEFTRPGRYVRLGLGWPEVAAAAPALRPQPRSTFRAGVPPATRFQERWRRPTWLPPSP